MSETIQLKYLGDTDVRFIAIDGSYVGILKPGDLFTVSKTIFDADLAQDHRYQVVTKTKSEKYKSEEK